MPVGVRVVVARASLSGCRGKMEVNLLECPDGLVSWFLSQVEIQNHVGPLSPQETPEVLCVLKLPLVCGLKAEESEFPGGPVVKILHSQCRDAAGVVRPLVRELRFHMVWTMGENKAEASLFPFSDISACLQAPDPWGRTSLLMYAWALGTVYPGESWLSCQWLGRVGPWMGPKHTLQCPHHPSGLFPLWAPQNWPGRLSPWTKAPGRGWNWTILPPLMGRKGDPGRPDGRLPPPARPHTHPYLDDSWEGNYFELVAARHAV